jgi:tight adherence protein C
MPGFVDIAAIALGGGISVALLAQGAMQLTGEHQLSRRLDTLGAGDAPGAAASGEATRQMLATMLNGGAEGREEVERHLAAAGYLSPNGALVFGVIRIGGPLLVALVLFLVLSVSGVSGAVSGAAAIGAASLVFLGARIVLKMSSARRQRKISAELPFTLDILVMMVESGASLDQCLRSFAATEGRAAPIVRVAVAELVEDLQRGMSYDQALMRWGDRLGVTGSRELATVLRQALNQGTELTGTLREFAREFAERRIFAARESIGRKTTQMTVAMLVLLMPALMIVLAGPAIATLGTTIRQISNK